MEHKFPLGSFHRENGTTFSGIPFFPEIFQWNEPKNHVPFTTQPEFPEFFSKWKTPYMSGFFKMGSSLRQNFFACLPATAGREAFAVLEKAGGGGSVKEGRGRKPRGLATSCYHRGAPGI